MRRRWNSLLAGRGEWSGLEGIMGDVGEQRGGSLKRSGSVHLGHLHTWPPGLTGWATSLGELDLPPVLQACSLPPRLCTLTPMPNALGRTQTRDAEPNSIQHGGVL